MGAGEPPPLVGERREGELFQPAFFGSISSMAAAWSDSLLLSWKTECNRNLQPL